MQTPPRTYRTGRPPKRDTPAEPHRIEAGRVQLRTQGDWWVAYLTPPLKVGEAEERVEIARIMLRIIASSPERKHQFIDLISAIMHDVVESVTGTRPEGAVVSKPGAAPDS